MTEFINQINEDIKEYQERYPHMPTRFYSYLPYVDIFPDTLLYLRLSD